MSPRPTQTPCARFISHARTHTSVKRERKFRRAYVTGGGGLLGSTKEKLRKGGAEKAASEERDISVSQRNRRDFVQLKSRSEGGCLNRAGIHASPSISLRRNNKPSSDFVARSASRNPEWVRRGRNAARNERREVSRFTAS